MKSEFESNRLDLLAELDNAEIQLVDQYENYINCSDIETAQIFAEQIDELQEHIKKIKLAL